VRKEIQLKPYATDGYQNSQWIVFDYGDTLVHIFLKEIRLFYNLESLWSDAKMTEYPDVFIIISITKNMTTQEKNKKKNTNKIFKGPKFKIEWFYGTIAVILFVYVFLLHHLLL
jgi:hypothetical protein